MPFTPEECWAKIQEVNAILEAGEPENITTNRQAKPVQTGYRSQTIIDAVNKIFFGRWGFKELSNDIAEGEKSIAAVAHIEVWLEGIDFKPTAWGQGRQKTNVGDVKKSSQTNGITKALAYFSIGSRAYLGLLPAGDEETDDDERRSVPVKSPAERMAEIKAAQLAKAPQSQPSESAASQAPTKRVPAPKKEPVVIAPPPQEVQPIPPEPEQEEQEEDLFAEFEELRKDLPEQQKTWLFDYCILRIDGLPREMEAWGEFMPQVLEHTKVWLDVTTPTQQATLKKGVPLVGGDLALDRLSNRMFGKPSGLLFAGLTSILITTLKEFLFTVNLANLYDPKLEYLGKNFKGAKVPLDLLYNHSIEGVRNDPEGYYLGELITRAKAHPELIGDPFRVKYADLIALYEILAPLQGNDADPNSPESYTI
jgi:hypothetical protein